MVFPDATLKTERVTTVFHVFSQFLQFIIHNLATLLRQTNPANDELVQEIFAIYMLLKRVQTHLDRFANTLIAWQTSFYHGSRWSAFHLHLEKLRRILVLLNDDLSGLIYHQNPQRDRDTEIYLGYQLRGTLPGDRADESSKSVFGVWLDILHQNQQGRLCGWVSNYSQTQGQTLDAFGKPIFFPDVTDRLIFIPPYSLLLPTITLTADLSDRNQSHWRRNIQPDLLYVKLSESQEQLLTDLLQFLPEFPPDFPIELPPQEISNLNGTRYAVMLQVPQQNAEMEQLITAIAEDVARCRTALTDLAETIKEIVGDRVELLL